MLAYGSDFNLHKMTDSEELNNTIYCRVVSDAKKMRVDTLTLGWVYVLSLFERLRYAIEVERIIE